MDDLDKIISEFQNKIVTAINESRLHPAILMLVLQNIQAQLNAELERAKQVAESETEK